MSSWRFLSLEDTFKKALFYQIEDEEDQIIADDAYKDYLDSGCQSMPAEEFWNELDKKQIN